MKFAAPLKMQKEESAITKVLGKAKYFGIYDEANNQLEVIVNEDPTGPAIFFVLKELGVDAVLDPACGSGGGQCLFETGDRSLLLWR